MTLALISWCIGAAFLTLFLSFFLRHGKIVAAAILIILIPQVFIRPLIFFAGLDTPYPYEFFDSSDWDLVASGLVVATAWIISFSLTHHFAYRPLMPLGQILPQVHGTIDVKVLFLVTLITTLIGVVLTSMLVLSAGSLMQFMYQVKIGKELAGSYVIREISVISAVFSVLTILVYEKRYRARLANGRGRGMVWISAALLITNLAFNYLWGNRYNIAMLGVAMGIAWHFHIKPIKLVNIIILVTVVGALLQGLKLVRNFAIEEVIGREVITGHSFWLDISTSLHLNQFDAFMLALRDAGERFDFRNGKDFVNGLLSWIPREFYPEKENYHIGGWFRRIYEPNVVNGWPITTIGTWYVNFGFFGIFIGSVISGAVVAIFDAAYKNARGSFWQAMVAPTLGFFMFDGGVSTGFVQSVFLMLIPIYMLSLVLRMAMKKGG